MSDNKLLLEGDDDKHLVIGLLRARMGKSVFDSRGCSQANDFATFMCYKIT